MQRISKQAITIALLAVSIFAIPGGNAAIAAKSNCNSVNKTYPFGIALNKQSIGTSRAETNRTKYLQLKYLDKDLDGIVCEIEKLQTKVTIPATIPVTTTTITRKVCVSRGACSVGDIGPGGGIVFYDAGSTQSWGRYLEAPLTDLEGLYSWSNAISAAQDYRGGGLTDWRLPSYDELKILAVNRDVVGGFTKDFYWSSREALPSICIPTPCKEIAFGLLFVKEGIPSSNYKTNTGYVRPLRAF